MRNHGKAIRCLSVVSTVLLCCLSTDVFGALAGDVNNDHEVNIKDLEVVSLYWLQDPDQDPDLDPSHLPDIDDSGVVDLKDFIHLSHNWGMKTNPVRIFILAGQSNMQGQGEIEMKQSFIDKNGGLGTLEYMTANMPEYQWIVDSQGNWRTWEDCWIHYERSSASTKYGDLTVAYGGANDEIGPELGFGRTVCEVMDNQALLIKTCWGGKSLAVDFRPPSSDGEVGFYYTEIFRIVDEVANNLSAYFLGYDNQGYEIAGFCWFQGWNDATSQDRSLEYEFNLANLIRDVRTELETPDLPFVIASSGFYGFNPPGGTAHGRAQKYLHPAQTAVAMHPEFQGTVHTVDARPFWRDPADSPTGQKYHWNGNSESFVNIGLGMGQAMNNLLDHPTATAPDIENLAPTDIDADSATMRGQVTDEGGEFPSVILFWGESDGGADPHSWDNSTNLGVHYGEFYAWIHSLKTNTAYYYRCYVANSAGDAWADDTESFITE